jgi:hypothetical protein
MLLALGAGLALSTHLAVQQAARAEAEEMRRRDALLAESGTAADEASQAEAGNARYLEMSARGMVGPEQRRGWLDEMARIAATHRLSGIEYELSPQRPATLALSPATARRLEFMASAMTLKAAAAHEQDLLGFLDDLAAAASSLLRVRSCRIERLAQADASADSRLRAECVIEWITLRTRS